MSTYIPARTRQHLSAPAGTGGRHAQLLKVIPSLLGQGLSSDAVFAQARQMYGEDVSDREIADVIRWASGKSFTPCSPRFTSKQMPSATRSAPTKPVDPVANITKFLGDFRTNDCDLWHVSPWRPLEDWRFDSLMFLAGMFHAGELVNIVTEHRDGGPIGYGITKTRDDWMRAIRDHGTPQGEAGAWVRMNPADGKGITDANIASHRFALLEFDHVPLELQLSLLARLPLPINAILLSGGRSAHGWVRLNSPTAEAYRDTVNEMLRLLAPFGVDPSNKNPSRLSRLVGAQRTLGASGDGQQRLLYLAPDRTDTNPIFGAQ